MIAKVRNNVFRFLNFLRRDLWSVELSTLSGQRRFLVRMLRTCHLVIKGLKEDNIPIHASALTLSTLIAIVPILAITLSMFKGLGAGEEEIRQLFAWMEDMPQEFQDFIDQMLLIYTETNFAALGGVFMVILLFMVIKMLSSIETTFNRVWYISTSRNIIRKISNYISLLVIVPILIVAAGAASAVVSGIFDERFEAVAAIYRRILQIGPFIATWMAFTFLYVFIPNTRVRAVPGLVSGLVGAVMWLGWQHIYMEFQIGISKYNAIYGTFASVPIFLVWLYVSWIIVLLGAELAFAIQNSTTYELERAASGASAKSKLMLTIGVLVHAAKSQESDSPLFNAYDYARNSEVSVRMVNDVVARLEDDGLMAQVADPPGCYALLKSPEMIRVRDVVERLLQDGTRPEELGLNHLDETVNRVVSSVDDGLNTAVEDLTVKDLLSLT